MHGFLVPKSVNHSQKPVSSYDSEKSLRVFLLLLFPYSEQDEICAILIKIIMMYTLIELLKKVCNTQNSQNEEEQK